MPADLSIFVEPSPAGPPAGAELRHDPRFHALERMMEPASRTARQRQGDGAMAPVDWGAVLEGARELASVGRDLRLLVVVARAEANRDGHAGLARGLSLLAETVERHWDGLHPELRDRPQPLDAALPRINALRQLENEQDGLLGDLQLGVALTARGIGAITGADLTAGSMTPHQVLSGAPSGLGQAERDALLAAHEERVSRVRAATRALAAEDPGRLGALLEGVRAARAALARLQGGVAGTLGLSNGQGLRLTELATFLERIDLTLTEAASTREAVVPEPDAAEPVAPSEAAAGTGAVAPRAAPGTIGSREDVVRCLDRIIAFYETKEPSSPIPHLARRMRRMVPMNFMELMAELAPSGVKEFRVAAGVADDKGK